MNTRAALAAPLPALSLLAVELGAVAASLIGFAVFLAVEGASPFSVLADMVDGAFGSWFSVQNSLSRAAPLMLTALCTAVPARLGMIIIGNEAALLMGGLAAAVCSMVLPPTAASGLALTIMLLAGALAGAVWIAISGVLRQQRGVHETISSLLLFYIGLSLFLHCVEGPLRDPGSLNKPGTPPLPEAFMLTGIGGSDVHWGILFGLCACAICYVLLEHTSFGFSVRVTGGNLKTARLMGLPVTQLCLLVCALGGAAAGVAGAIEVAAIHGSANRALYAGLGFSGVLVAFVARQHPLAIIPVAILLGGIQASGGVLQRRHGLPDAAVEVFKGILFISVLAAESYVLPAMTWAERKRQAWSTPPAPQPLAAPEELLLPAAPETSEAAGSAQ
jgi:simple sugar transport system permease protein